MRGFCGWTQHVTVMEDESYDVEVYRLQPEALRKHLKETFTARVKDTMSYNKKTLSKYMTEFLKRDVDKAHTRINGYSTRYLETILNSLEVSRRGAASQAAALHQVQTYVGELEALLQRTMREKAASEALLSKAKGITAAEEAVATEAVSNTAADWSLDTAAPLTAA